MKRNFEKSIHILNQIMGFCKKEGGTEINSKIIINGEDVLISVATYVENISEKTINDLRREIEIPRQEEIEQNYWNIGLSGNLGDEMALVGMMVDKSSVYYENNVLFINIERRN